MRSWWVVRSLARRWFGSQSSRPISRKTRRHPARRARLGPQVEQLEDRTLLSVLPAPLTTAHLDITNQNGNENTPSVVVDPVNPSHLVAVYTANLPGPDGAGQVTEVQLSYSTDAGQTWNSFGNVGTNLTDPLKFTGQTAYTYATDPSVAFDRFGRFYVLYAQEQGPDLAGRTASGAIVLKKYDFNGPTPSALVFPPADADPNTIPLNRTVHVLSQWVGTDPALNPRLVVDSNLASFTDPVTGATQTDTHANGTGDPKNDQLYVAWNTNNAAPTGATSRFNPNAIKIIASADGGNTFTTQSYVNRGMNLISNGNGERDSLPVLSVAQGTRDGRVSGGLVSVAFDDFGDKQLVTSTIPDGGTGLSFTGGLNGIGPGGTSVGTKIVDAAPDVPSTTTYTANTAAPLPANFGNISDFNVDLALVHPHLNQLQIVLIAPGGATFLLLDNRTDAAGNTRVDSLGRPLGVADQANLGMIATHEVDTVFDDRAARSITDTGATAPYTAHFRSEGSNLGFYDGSLPSTANIIGTWQLRITDFRNDGSTPPTQFLQHWSLNFTSHLTPSANVVAVAPPPNPPGPLPNIGIVIDGAALGPFPDTAVPAEPVRGVGPSPSIAVDNTLGSFTPYQGRIYLAYTGVSDNKFNSSTNPDIFLVTSDNGGQTWSAPAQVNDDEFVDSSKVVAKSVFALDNFSEGNRAQFMPSVAVDPVTGTLGISFYDARHDAANARVATFLATSIDGGGSFAPESYLNASRQALDEANFDPNTGTNTVVNLEPIPDNQSSGNPGRDQTFGFGDHQTLALYGGHVYALWSGNENGGPRLTDDRTGLFTTKALDILSTITTIAAGPRFLPATDMGPVQARTVTDYRGFQVSYNNTFSPESASNAGTQQASGFVVTFDRPVDVASFTANLVNVVYRGVSTPTTGAAPFFGGTQIDPTSYVVTPLSDGSTNFQYGPNRAGGINPRTNKPYLDTKFLVTFKPQDATGTYSYSVNPGIQDDVRQGNGVTTGNRIDQNGNAVTGETNVDAFAVPRPTNGVPFNLPYDPTTLPLIVSGPHVVQSFVPNNPLSFDNLILNGTATALDVVFDRDMNASSFTPAQLLRLVGPTGNIPLFDALGVPLPGVSVVADPGRQLDSKGNLIKGPDPDANNPRTFKITLPNNLFVQNDGSIATGPSTRWPVLSLSGTYNLVLGTGIRAKNGDLVDANQNAGLAVLRGADPTSVNLVPGGISHDSGTTAIVIPPTPAPTPGNPNPPASSGISTITFPESFLIQHVQLQLNISSPNSQDLRGQLIAPNNAVIQLFAHPGGVPRAGQQTGFIATVLDDRGALPIQPDSLGNGPPQPFRGTFAPEQPLSTLNGINANGTWTLKIFNDSTNGSHAATITNWRLTFDEAVLPTGLGEQAADQSTVHFRVFTQDPGNPLAHSQWTAVGPAAIGINGSSGRIGGIAVDPADSSGNTVYVAGASGGVWKTTNFLTTDGQGPTYVPVTDFGPANAINVGGIAVFGQNNDPRLSKVFVATGEGDTGTTGVGFLRSLDGGASWQVLDSTVNVDSSGNLLPINSPQRDHILVGTTSYKIIVDPLPTPSGQVAVYAALSPTNGGTNGGIWRSLDSGNTWQNVLPGNATDVVLAPYSAYNPNNPSAPPGNAQILYAAIAGKGVFVSNTQGNAGTWTLMAGSQGGDPLLRDFKTGFSIAAGSPLKFPSDPQGRIVLAVPGLTGTLVPGQPYNGNRARDLNYENWVYATVITGGAAGRSGGGGLYGLFVTKDGGKNWTNFHIPFAGVEDGSPTQMVFPTNDETKPDFGPFSAGPLFGGGQGNYDVSLSVDPNNPNVLYLGGTADGPPWALSRIDTTGVMDPYAVVSYDNSNNDGGTLAQASKGAVNGGGQYPTPFFAGVVDPTGNAPLPLPYLNALRQPNNIFSTDATRFTVDIAAFGFNNLGQDIQWGAFHGAGGTDHHRVVVLRDPLTGQSRLIFGDDQGIWTSLATPEGNFLNRIGNVAEPSVSRNGNLQITQFYYGAAQPSNLAAQIAGAMFYANAQDNGFPVSDPNVLQNGNIAWHGPGGDGTGIATDQTGAGTVYSYQWPCCGSHTGFTDFFNVNPAGGSGLPDSVFFPGSSSGLSRTNGLIERNDPGPIPDRQQWPFLGGSNFAVNPTNGNDILMSAQDGTIFRTGDQGLDWNAVAFPPGDFLNRNTPTNTLDGNYAPAEAFGAFDPKDKSSRPDLNFLYVGTSRSINSGGNLYVTLDGGGVWTNLTPGSVGGSIEAISPNPKPGTHEVYFVADNGVFYATYDVSYSPAGVPSVKAGSIQLTPINGANTDSIFAQQHQVFFKNSGNGAGDLLPFLNDSAGNPTALHALAADWRFVVPDDPTNPASPTHPVLYVGGQGGVFRSTDKGNTWRAFPNIADDGAPMDGGLFPIAQVSSLSLAVGNIDPQTGLPTQATGPNLLYAATYGRGTFAIRLPLTSPFNPAAGPQVTSAVATNATGGSLPNPVNSVVGLNKIIVTFNEALDPTTFTTNNITLKRPGGTVIPITGFQDISPTTNLGNLHNVWEIDFAKQSTNGNYTLAIGPDTTIPGKPRYITDFAGHLMDQDLDILDQPGNLDDNIPAGQPNSGQEADDAFTTTYTIAGLRITNVVPADGSSLVTPPGLQTMTVTFNAPVDTATFTAADVTVLDPNNRSITPVTVTDVTIPAPGQPNLHNIWQIGIASQLKPGTYTLLVGPHISDTGDGQGRNEQEMDQNQNGIFGQLGVSPVGDVFQATYTIDGLRVIAVTPDPTKPVLEPPGLQTIQITFNREVKPATFTTAQLSLTAPDGSTITIPPANLVDTAGAPLHNVWTVTLPAAIVTPGIYTLLVGPGITDSTGTAMDQNQNQIYGENPGDKYVAKFDVDGLAVKSVAPTNAVPQPPGLNNVTITFNQGVLTSSLNTTNVTLTAPNNQPVTIIGFTDVTPAGSPAKTVWRVDFTPLNTYGGYQLVVGTGVKDLAGNPMNQNHNLIYGESTPAPGPDAFPATFTIAGLQVTAVTPDPTKPVLEGPGPGLQTIQITFNMQVQPSSFTTSQVSLLAPDGTPITPLGLTDNAGAPLHNVWTVTLPSSAVTPGIYTLIVGPGILDAAGNPMDQNEDHTGKPFTTRFDVDGLAVKSVAPANTSIVAPGVTSVSVTFNQGVLASSLNTTNVTLTNPAGTAIAGLTFQDVTPAGAPAKTVWQINFPAQNIPGNYKLVVGTGVKDLAGNPMNQNHNLVYGESTPAPGPDAFVTIFGIVGLRVLTIAPDISAPVPVSPGLQSIVVTFNREVNPASFTTSQVVLKGPGGAVIQPLAFSDQTLTTTNLHNVWKLTLPSAQTTPGIYTLTIGPGVTDSTGTAMDQNQNGVFGENPDDQKVGLIDVAGLAVTNVDPSGSVPVPAGLSSLNITFNQGVLGSTMNASNITLTDPTNTPVSLVGFNDVTPAGAPAGTVWKVTFPSQGIYGTYHLTVGVGVADLAGNPLNQNQNGVYGETAPPPGDVYTTTFSIAGLQIVSMTPTSPVPATPGLSAITVTFNMAVNLTTFTPDKVSLLDPNGAAVLGLTTTDITAATLQPGAVNLHNIWEIDLPSPATTQGNYLLTVGPGVKDTAGHQMDQNQNGIFGQSGPAPVGDQFTATIVVGQPPPPPPPPPNNGGGITPPPATITGPADVTNLVSILIGKARRKPNGKYVQKVQIFNVSNTPIQGPFALVLDGLTRRVRLRNANGLTRTHPPLGSPYQILVFNSATLNSLGGGTFTLVFTNPLNRRIHWNARLLAGITQP